MTKMTVKYLGGLRVECVHLPSGVKLITDAPVDNQGKGEAFSPTDLCAVSLAACILTVLGIYGEKHQVDLTGIEAEISKEMVNEPRRIGKIDIIVNMPPKNYSQKEKLILPRIANTCAVHYSLSEQVVQNIIFNWR